MRKLKDSGIEWIGEIPEHWILNKLKYLSLDIGDGIHATPTYDVDGNIYFVNGNNIGEEYLVFKEDTNTISDTEYASYKLPLLTENTVFITLNGATYGKTSFYHGEKVLLGKSAGFITLKSTESREFIRYYLQSYTAKLIMDLSLLGSTIANLSLRTLRDFVIPYPPKEEQIQIVNHLNNRISGIDAAVSKKKKIVDELIDYKKSLIYEVVTGKKEV
jgi:type I restriction enzyme S subunit